MTEPFKEAFRYCIPLGLLADEQEKLRECISMFERCKELVDHLALFSQNEGIDDLASSEMK